MQLEQLYFLAEIIAALAVVISLVYLALQVKQARVQDKTNAMDLIVKQRADFVEILATNKELCYVVSKGLTGQRLSNLDYNRFNYYLYSLCVNFELAFIKYQDKSISDEAWKAWDEGCNSWFMFPGFQKWWSNNHVGGFTQSFKDHVNTCISTCKKNPNKYQQNIMAFLQEMNYTDTYTLEEGE
jgi:hypothetical protein